MGSVLGPDGSAVDPSSRFGGPAQCGRARTRSNRAWAADGRAIQRGWGCRLACDRTDDSLPAEGAFGPCKTNAPPELYHRQNKATNP
jgi:hypothetical protein